MAMKNAIVIKDDLFNPDIWEDGLYSFHIAADRGHDTEAVYFTTQVDSGGNPGAYRSTIHQWGNREGHKHSDISVYHFNRNATVDPQRGGGIEKIDVSYDLRNIDPVFDGIEIMYAILLRQDGNYFIGANRTIKSTNWTSFHIPALQAKDFARIHVINPAPTTPLSAQQQAVKNPDFSANGKPIQFGYTTMNTTNARQMESISGIDNWTIVVHTVQAVVQPQALLSSQATATSTTASAGASSGASDRVRDNDMLTNQLLDKIHQLEEEVKKEKADREALAKALTENSLQTARQVAETKSRHAYTEAALNEKSDQLNITQRDIAQLKRAVAEARENESMMQQKCAATITELNMIKSNLDTTHKILADEREKAKAIIADLEGQKASLMQQHSTAVSQLQQERAELSRTARTSGIYQREIDSLKLHVASLSSETSEYKQFIASMESTHAAKVLDMETEFKAKWEALNASHKARLADIETIHAAKLTSLEAHNKKAVADVEAKYLASVATIAAVEQQLKASEQKVITLAESNASLADSYQNCQQQLDAAKMDIARKQRDLQEAADLSAQQETKHKAVASELTATKQQLKALLLETTQLQERYLSVQQSYAALEEQLIVEQQKLASAKASPPSPSNKQTEDEQAMRNANNNNNNNRVMDDMDSSVRVSVVGANRRLPLPMVMENYVGQMSARQDDDYEQIAASASMFLHSPSAHVPVPAATTAAATTVVPPAEPVATPAATTTATAETATTGSPTNGNQGDEWELLTDTMVITGSASAKSLDTNDEI